MNPIKAEAGTVTKHEYYKDLPERIKQEGLHQIPNPKLPDIRDEPTNTDPTPWYKRGACLGLPFEMFELRGLSPTKRKIHETTALEICSQCVVIEPCLEAGLLTRRTGDQAIFGNKTLAEIRKLSGEKI